MKLSSVASLLFAAAAYMALCAAPRTAFSENKTAAPAPDKDSSYRSYKSYMSHLSTSSITTSTAEQLPASDLLWYNGAELGLEGRGWTETSGTYARLPARSLDLVTSSVSNLSRHTAGLCLRFITDADRIDALWDGGEGMAHMAPTGSTGLDLYRREGDRWVFRAVGFPKKTKTTATLAKELPTTPGEFLLYLPLYHEVTELKIGIPSGARIAPAPARPSDSKPIVFYGTSITQGGCASRAGMCHPAIIGRRFNREVINLGFSGSGRMEPAMADLLAELDPAIYVLECLPNMKLEMVSERVEPFVRRLRAKRPNTPILLVENPLKLRSDEQNKALRTAFDNLKSAGVPGLHYLEGEGQLDGEENGTVDAVHPTDLGFLRMADAYSPTIAKIIEE